MSKELVKVDPKEFGLDETNGKTIQEAFLPKTQERDGYLEMYNNLLKKEITESTCAEAKALRLKLVKVRTGLVAIHKTQKEFSLSYGRLCDAWKNKEVLPGIQMEEKLMDIEKFFEKQEEERLIKLNKSRLKEITPFLRPDAPQPIDLGYMPDDVWENYLLGAKASHEQRLQAEKKAEEERIAAEKKAEEERLAAEAEQERIRKENEKLKKEAEAKEAARLAELKAIEKKEKAAQVERDRLAKIEANKQAKIKAELEAKAEAEKQSRLKAEKEAEAKRIKLENELKAKLKAEQEEKERLAKIEADKLEAERLASLAPEKEKISKWIDSMTIRAIGCEGFSDDGIAVCNSIFEKFNAFKKWAESQKDTIK